MDEKGALDKYKDQLEDLAVATWFDILSNQHIDPKVRKDTADSVMKALGKDAPPKAGPVSFVFNMEVKESDCRDGHLPETAGEG